MAAVNDRFEVPGMEERKAASKRPATIDKTNMLRLEKALLPYEKKLQRQERFRRMLGVKEVERPTYERYITGPVERFDKNRMAFLCMRPENPFGEDLRRKFKERTGYDHYLSPLAYEELDYEDRIGRAVADASYRGCAEYEPKPFVVTPLEGRLEIRDRAWISRLIKKIGLMFGADLVRKEAKDAKSVIGRHQYHSIAGKDFAIEESFYSRSGEIASTMEPDHNGDR